MKQSTSILIDDEMIPDIQYIIFHKCTPTWELSKHRLQSYNMTYIIKGEARYTINDQTIDMGSGGLLLLPKNCTRKGITFPDRLMHCFSVDFSLLKKKRQNYTFTPSHCSLPLYSVPGCHKDIIHLFYELSFSWLGKQPGYIIKCNGLFLQILHRFLELIIYKTDSYSVDSRITKVIRYITAHYSEHNTVKKMAEIVGLNPAYFGILFRQTMGVSFNHYLIQTRVKYAENMLFTGEYKVRDVAKVCGFSDASHFYKQFKLIKGFPPSCSLPKKF